MEYGKGGLGNLGRLLLLLVVGVWGCLACSKESVVPQEPELEHLSRLKHPRSGLSQANLEPLYTIPTHTTLTLEPTLPSDSLLWTLEHDGRFVTLGCSPRQTFAFAEPGSYTAHCTVLRPAPSIVLSTTIVVTPRSDKPTPYISAVYDYRPAPGQWVNLLPAYAPGDTQVQMNTKVLQAIGQHRCEMISLGGYGGYVEFGFDHSIVNRPGPDLMIHGNANSRGHGDPIHDRSGSAEPGIVMVGVDHNRNGRPDPGEWYELRGAAHASPHTLHGYSITYRCDSILATRDPLGDGWIERYMPWSDNRGQTGFVHRNPYHQQCYWPLWLMDSASLTFVGTRLPANSSREHAVFNLYSFDWGYADNLPNDREMGFDISNAITPDGRPARLGGIDFVRVYTAVNQYCGWIGESSTEIVDAYDMSLLE